MRPMVNPKGRMVGVYCHCCIDVAAHQLSDEHILNGDQIGSQMMFTNQSSSVTEVRFLPVLVGSLSK